MNSKTAQEHADRQKTDDGNAVALMMSGLL